MNTNIIDTTSTIPSTLSTAEALARLYNRAKPLGMGFMQYEPRDMTPAEAQALLDGGATYFDYLKGRVLKVSVAEIEQAIADGKGDFRLYDRDNGHGAAMQALTAT